MRSSKLSQCEDNPFRTLDESIRSTLTRSGRCWPPCFTQYSLEASARRFAPSGEELFFNHTYLASPPDHVAYWSDSGRSRSEQVRSGFLVGILAGRQE